MVPRDEQALAFPLSFHLSYHYLPADQAASFIKSITDVYNTLLPLAQTPDRRYWRYLHWRRFYEKFPGPFFWGPPLCWESAISGESITFGFAVRSKFLPQLAFSERELKVLIPRWTAVLVLAGAAFTWGLGQSRKRRYFSGSQPGNSLPDCNLCGWAPARVGL